MALTIGEHYRLHGSLTAAQIENLLDLAEDAESATDVTPWLEEAMGQYPDEDFLSGVEKQLSRLSEHVRGENRERVLAIATAVAEIAQSQSNAADYGRGELSKALKAVSLASWR